MNRLFSLFRPSVDSIIGDITKKIEKLKILADLKNAEANAHASVIVEKTRLAQAARAEKERALAIADKLKNLVGV